MEIPSRNVAIINPGPIDIVQRKRDPSGGVTIHACTRRANGEGLYRGRGQGRHDSKDRPCCIIHGEKGETKRKLEEERKKDGEEIQIGRKSEEFCGKRLMKTVDAGQWGYKTIEKRLIPEEDDRMKSDITRGRPLIQPNCSFMRIFEIFMKLYENFLSSATRAAPFELYSSRRGVSSAGMAKVLRQR